MRLDERVEESSEVCVSSSFQVINLSHGALLTIENYMTRENRVLNPDILSAVKDVRHTNKRRLVEVQLCLRYGREAVL